MKAVAGDQVAREARLLFVALDRQLEPALLARRQIADPQPGLVVDPRAVDQPGAIGREERAERRCRARR